jgi:hypothetical protein
MPPSRIGPGSALHGAKEVRLIKINGVEQAGESLSADAVRPASALQRVTHPYDKLNLAELFLTPPSPAFICL